MGFLLLLVFRQQSGNRGDGMNRLGQLTSAAVILHCAFWLAAPAWAQEPDAEIAGYVNSIRAIDNHAHVTGLDLEQDRGFDQLRCDELAPSSGLGPANLRFGADQRAAYQSLFGFDAKTGDDAEIKKVIEMEGRGESTAPNSMRG
jgi:hypothetical protein